MFDNLLGNGKSQLPSVIKDPFKKDCVTHINLFMGNWGRGIWSGSVEFQNGKTSGKQEIEKTEDFDHAVRQLRELIESVK